jgi:hypothetical protein
MRKESISGSSVGTKFSAALAVRADVISARCRMIFSCCQDES